jgi:broad specificity phosphatase PhoE
MTLLVVRHARVTTKGLCYGQSDVPVSLDDEAACDLVVGQLAAFATPVGRVWSSPWQRARGPAERVAAKLGVAHTIDERLSELAFGGWEGRPYAELETKPAFQAWMASWQSAAPPGGERLDELLHRVRAWRDEVLARGELALAITHAGVIRALRAEARQVPYAEVIGEPVEPLRIETL